MFEGERVYSGEIFKLNEHSERLCSSAEMLDFIVPFTAAQLDEASREVCKANNIVDGYVRPLAWRGSEQIAVSAQNCSVHVAIACWQWPKYFFPKGGDEGGIALRTSKWRRPDPTTAPVQAKACGNYAIGTMAKHEAERAGYDDALLHDYKGRVAESSGSNLFIVKDGKLKTPVPECFLNGITRQTVIKMVRDMGYTMEEGTIMPEDLRNVDEIFVTGTAAEIAAISKIDDMTFKVGPVTKKLQAGYADLVRSKAKAAA